MVFDRISQEVAEFYLREGYCHLRTGDPGFLEMVSAGHAYYSGYALKSNVAFRNASGVPRHVIDVFRDLASPAMQLYRSEVITSAIELLYPGRGCLVFTHSKLSFKTPGAAVNWFPHQDNGYKSRTDLRVGFAIFICLEDMDTENGCLEVFPGSHKLGTLAHERVVEDRLTGDNQLCIPEVPGGLQSRPIAGRRGDVVVFSANTIHQSGSSTTSRRLALIAEVEEYTACKLDDYGKLPIVVRGAYSKGDAFMMSLKSVMSPYRFWDLIKKNRRLGSLARKLRYR